MSEQGTVKFFNTSKRYGFIKPNSAGRDLFFHGSVLSDADSDAMDAGGTGIVVSFERGTRDGRPVAVNVRIIDDGE